MPLSALLLVRCCQGLRSWPLEQVDFPATGSPALGNQVSVQRVLTFCVGLSFMVNGSGVGVLTSSSHRSKMTLVRRRCRPPRGKNSHEPDERVASSWLPLCD